MDGHFDLGEITPLRYFSTIAIVLGLVFASINQASSDIEPWLHYLQWQFQTITPIFLLILSHVYLNKLPYFENQNPWLTLFISGLIGALAFSPAAMAIDLFLHNEKIDKGTLLIEWLDELEGVAVPMIICWVAINAPWVLGFKVEKKQQEQTVTPAADTIDKATTPSAHDLNTMIPSNIRGELIYIKAELHYVKVVTVKGSALVLYNLKDAINELPAGTGIQPHRSYWVALDQITAFHKDGRQGYLELSNNEKIPISRRNIQKVAAAQDHFLASQQ